MPEEVSASLNIRVQPNASQNKVTSYVDGVLHIRIAAAPVHGKANQELIKFLSKVLGVSKSNLSIKKGAASRQKVVAVEGLSQADAEAVIGKQAPLL